MSISEGLLDYLFSIETSLSSYLAQLEDLSRIISGQDLSIHEYNSAERLLQLSTEASIGLAKRWVKLIYQSSPSSAYDNLVFLKQAKKIDQSRLNNWKKIIGTRNALVHDYLEIDQTLIKQIIEKKEYQEIFDFAALVIQAIREGDINNDAL